MAETWVEIGNLEDIPRRGARCVKIGDMNIAVFRTADDQVFALEDKCPHLGGPLSQGIVHDCRVTCPLHSWILDLKTGAVVGPDEGGAAHVPVKVEAGKILINPANAGSHTPALEDAAP